MNKLIKNIGAIFLIFISISVLFALYNSERSFNKTEEISLGRLVEEIRGDQVKKITVSGEKVTVELKDSQKQSAIKEKESSLSETLKNYGLESEKLQSVEISMEGEGGVSYWLATILPILLPFILIAGIFWLMLRQAQKGNAQALSFGLSRARWEDPRKKKHQTTFKDVAGADEAKEELN